MTTDKRPQLPTPNNLGHYNTAELLAYGAACEAYGRASAQPTEPTKVTSKMVRAALAAEYNGNLVSDYLMMGTDFDYEVMEAALTAALRAREGR